MATFNFADLIKPVTVDEAQSAVYEILAKLGVSTSVWKTGSVVRTMIHSLCTVYSGFSQLQADAIAGGFLQFAEGPWLTAKAQYDYGVERYDATFAVGTVTFTNTSAYDYSELAGDVTVAHTTSGKNYRTMQDLVLPAGATATVEVSAIEAGTASNAVPGTITVLVTTLLGVSCTNSDALVASDEETDAQLRERCSDRLGALSPNGAPDAYEFAALSATRPDGSNVGITRVQTTTDMQGNVYVYVANAAGDVPPGDIALVEESIEAVYKVVPLAVHAHVVGAATADVTVAGDIWVHGSALSDTDIQTAIGNALIAFFAEQPIGGNVIAPATTGYIYLDAIRAAVMEAVPTAFHCVLSSPSADVALADNEVAALAGSVTFVIHQEA